MSADLHTLVGAYALHALDPPEEASFEDHLDRCPTCTAELREFRATAARLGEAAEETPPEHLRAAVLTAAHHTAPQRPVVTQVSSARWQRRLGTRLPGLLAAAALLTAVAIGGLWWADQDDNGGPSSGDDAYAKVMAAPDLVTRPRGPDETPVRVYSSPSLGQAVVVVDELPSPGAEQSYEMWAMHDDGSVSSLGAMPESAGSGRLLVDDVAEMVGVAVTVEPAGGSPSGQPTGDTVARVRLA